VWRRILALILKEFRAIWKDPKSRYIVIVPPLIQAVLFAQAATFEVTRVALGVWNEDRALAATELLSRFDGSPAFRLAGSFDNPAEVAEAVSAERVKAVLHIGQTFSADVLAGRPAKVQLLLDGRRSNTALIVQNYAAEIVARYDLERLQSTGLAGQVSMETRAWFNPNYDSKWFILPGLTVLLTAIATLLITALSVARERELGTFEQLLVSPLTPFEILIGKAVPAFLIGIGEASLILLLSVFVLGVPFRGDLALLYAGMAVYLAAVIGVGLFISSIVATQQQAILGAFTFFAPSILLSGFLTPVENMPAWLQPLTLIDPMTYFTVISRGIFLKAMPAVEVLANLWPMALIAVVTLSSAAWLFGRRLQ